MLRLLNTTKSMLRPLLGMTLLSLLPVILHGDTLFKKRHPFAIGHGVDKNNGIVWENCDGSNKNVFEKPPYWLDKADNCNVNVSSFGLKEQRGIFVVEDQRKTQKFLPTVQKGDHIRFGKTADSVTLASDSDSVTIARQLSSGTGTSSGAARKNPKKKK